MSVGKRGKVQTSYVRAREKVEAEGQCRICGDTRDLEAAHTYGKCQDVEVVGPRGGRHKYVPEEAVIPLCGGFSDNNCHGAYDRHEIDILPYLYLDEEINLVRAAGGIYGAYRRACPTAFKTEAADARRV